MPFHDDPFFHALQQSPDDDSLRLIYADYLAERGDAASAARAELIRVQLERAALPARGPDTAERTALHAAREAELLARWRRAWLGPWADSVHEVTFRRGLVEAVQADAAVFLKHAADWFAEWPTLTVAKLTRVGDLLPDLAASPWLAHLRGLDLSGNGIAGAALAPLASSRFVPLLQALDLSDNPIGPDGAEQLARSQRLEELTELHLAKCELWHRGLVALLGTPFRWRRLDLSHNGLNRGGLARLVDSPLLRHLVSLDLAGNPLDSHAMAALADAPDAAALVDLGLRDTDLRDAGLTALANSPNLPALRSLDLRGHDCAPVQDRTGRYVGGMAELARSPLLGRLRRLLVGRGVSIPKQTVPVGPAWTAEVLCPVRPPRTLKLVTSPRLAAVLRGSPYLIPTLLEECDLEEIWWLGDRQHRERLPTGYYQVQYLLDQFPELVDRLNPTQAAVVRARFTREEGPLSLADAAELLGLTPARILEVEGEARARLNELGRAMPSSEWWPG